MRDDGNGITFDEFIKLLRETSRHWEMTGSGAIRHAAEVPEWAPDACSCPANVVAEPRRYADHVRLRIVSAADDQSSHSPTHAADRKAIIDACGLIESGAQL